MTVNKPAIDVDDLYRQFCLARQPPDFDWASSRLCRDFVKSLSSLNCHSHQTKSTDEVVKTDAVNDDDLSLAFDHHSLVTAQLPNDTDGDIFPPSADEVIREIDLIMGHIDEPPVSPNYDASFYGTMDYSLSELPEVSQFNESDLACMTLPQLSLLVEEVEACVQNCSTALVQELAYREELDFEQEQKDCFIAQLDKLQRRIDRQNNNSRSFAGLDGEDDDNQSESDDESGGECQQDVPSTATNNRQSVSSSADHPTTSPLRQLALTRLRAWASANASGIKSRATTTFRSLLRRASKRAGDRLSSSATVDSTDKSSSGGETLTHSTSGHLMTYAPTDLDYKV